MTDQRPRLFLIDGSGYIFRAFFAIPLLSNASGLPTNAILGFTNMLLKLVKQHRPEYIGVALDAGRETFRNQMLAAYKSDRPEAPVDLIPQFPYLCKVLEALNLLLLELPGYEADDIIATLCRNGVGIRVETVAELRRALENAAQSSSFVIIEAMTGYCDLSPISVKYIRASAKRALKSAKV
jgi:hypothetical protein